MFSKIIPCRKLGTRECGGGVGSGLAQKVALDTDLNGSSEGGSSAGIWGKSFEGRGNSQ